MALSKQKNSLTRPIILIPGVIIAIIGLAVAYWLFSPLLRDEEVNEDFQYSVQAVIPDNMSQSDAEATMVTAGESDDATIQDEMPEAEQVALKLLRGEFQDQDAVHKGSGSAFIFELPDGSHVLRFEDFRVTNGPDLHVLISPDGTAGSATDLGSLKGNAGNQNYEIPADFDVTSLDSVIIYCSPFRVTFSVAKLAPPTVE